MQALQRGFKGEPLPPQIDFATLRIRLLSSLRLREIMKTRYRLTCCGIRGGKYYCMDTITGKRTSLVPLPPPFPIPQLSLNLPFAPIKPQQLRQSKRRNLKTQHGQNTWEGPKTSFPLCY
jgi:hypothetical protein